ncbi:MAG: YfiR family protein [Desulfobacteraceae bacterium]|nr:YfiR family protein [Desulfobacteraceae bacterium]
MMIKLSYFLRIIFIFLIFPFIAYGSALGQQPVNITEHYLKAAFIVNFARLVEWPDIPHVEKNQRIVIGVIDPQPFGDSLKAISKKEIRGKKILIKICDSSTDYSEVHILFLNSKDAKLRRQIINKISDKPILTIGETPGFAQQEGIINFYKFKKKLRFEINRTKAENAGLKISSRLLKLGKIIIPKGS